MEYKYNDNELLYLFSEGIEEALEILLEKYVGLIRKRISTFKIQMRFRDDFLQEGYMALLIAIRTYYQESPKTFNKYFDLILQRRFIKILKSDKNYIYNVTLYEDFSYVANALEEKTEIYYEDTYNLGALSKFEKKVFGMLREGRSVNEISLELNVTCKSVYNCVYRIKNKM